LDAQEILWPISEAIDNLRYCRDEIGKLAAEKFMRDEDQEASRIRDLTNQIEEIANDLKTGKDVFVERLDRILEKLRQEHNIQEISLISGKGRGRSSFTAKKSPVVRVPRINRKALILESEERQSDTIMDLESTTSDELGVEFWGLPIEGVSLMVFEESGEYSLQQAINIRAIAEAEMGGSIDDDIIIEIEEDCMSSIFKDGKYRLDIDDVIIEMTCYRYLSGNDVEEVRDYFLGREELEEAKVKISALARRVAG